MKMRIEGLRDIERAMMELKAVSAKAAARRVLKKAAQPIADAGRANAPERTGALKRSYGVGTRLTKRQRAVSPKVSPVEVFVGPGQEGAQQGVQTEFGNAHQAAEPHLRPAWDAHKRDALRTVTEELAADVERAVVRARRRAAKGGR
jgi:HK97 gp10 family phage protein